MTYDGSIEIRVTVGGSSPGRSLRVEVKKGGGVVAKGDTDNRGYVTLNIPKDTTLVAWSGGESSREFTHKSSGPILVRR